jgi:hypothetical protein
MTTTAIQDRVSYRVETTYYSSPYYVNAEWSLFANYSTQHEAHLAVERARELGAKWVRVVMETTFKNF